MLCWQSFFFFFWHCFRVFVFSHKLKVCGNLVLSDANYHLTIKYLKSKYEYCFLDIMLLHSVVTRLVYSINITFTVCTEKAPYLCGSLYFDICLIAVVWDWACSVSDMCMYLFICYSISFTQGSTIMFLTIPPCVYNLSTEKLYQHVLSIYSIAGTCYLL